MDFTREPVVETVITPREGCKLAIRSSKGMTQEEHFVDSVEIVSFGHALFFRSLEKPKNFLLPCTDYEVLEVREARMVLKHANQEKAIKIGGGKPPAPKKLEVPEEPSQEESETSSEEPKMDKKRERRRSSRRRRGREGNETLSDEGSKVELPRPQETLSSPLAEERPPELVRALLTPPPLISETINRYREDFSQAFYNREEDEQLTKESSEEGNPSDEASFRESLESSPTLGETRTGDLWDFTEELTSPKKEED